MSAPFFYIMLQKNYQCLSSLFGTEQRKEKKSLAALRHQALMKMIEAAEAVMSSSIAKVGPWAFG